MQANKIILNDEVLIDLTEDTVTEVDVAEGKTFHKADGTTGIGSLVAGSGDTLKAVFDVTKTAKELLRNKSELTSVNNMFNFDTTENVTNMGSMFSGCSSLTEVPSFDTSNVTNMNSMFSGCTNLTSVPLFDTSNVTDMYGMFYICSNLSTVPTFNTSNVTNMYGMFYNCRSLTSAPLFDTTENVTNMQSMFQYCTNLTEVPLFNTSNVTNMRDMFNSCTKLTSVPLFDTSSVTSMYGMFSSCQGLKTTPLLDASSVTNMYGMFYSCLNLNTALLLNTSNVTSMESMFYNCNALQLVDISDMSSVTNTNIMLGNCMNLRYVKFGKVTSNTKFTSNTFSTTGTNREHLRTIDFSNATGVPTLASTFSYLPTFYKIIIPDELYDEWIVATNWAGLKGMYIKASEYNDPQIVFTEGTPDLAYTISGSGNSRKVYCSGIGETNEEEIEIANTYDGIVVGEIRYDAFKNCTFLKSITIADSIKRINRDAFSGCISLTKVNFKGTIDDWAQLSAGTYNPTYIAKDLHINDVLLTHADIKYVPSIVGHAFACCESLVSVTMSDRVKSIGTQAFSNCSNLKRVDMSAYTSVPTLSNVDAFANTHEELEIKVPSNLIEEWKAAENWIEYADQIVEDFTNTI